MHGIIPGITIETDHKGISNEATMGGGSTFYIGILRINL